MTSRSLLLSREETYASSCMTWMWPLGCGEMVNHATEGCTPVWLPFLQRNVLPIRTSQIEGKEVVFSKARLYRKVRGLGWPNPHSSADHHPILFCIVSLAKNICRQGFVTVHTLAMSQSHLYRVMPFYSDTAEFGQGTKPLSNWCSWSLSSLQANNAASPCFVLGTEEQGRWLKTLNNFTAQQETKTIWPSTGSGRSTVGYHCTVSATCAMAKCSWTRKQPVKYLSGSSQKRQHFKS